jgi:hypothetical protein
MEFHRWRRDNPGGTRDQWIASGNAPTHLQPSGDSATPSAPDDTVTVAGKEFPRRNTITGGGGESFESFRSGGGDTRIDGGGGGDFGKIMDLIMENPGALAELDEGTLQSLEQIRQSQLAGAEQAFGDEKNALLRDLFGRGVQRSTIAGEAGGRLLSRRAAVLAGIEGEAGARNINLRQNIRDARLQALLGGGQLQNQRFDSQVRLKVGMAQVAAENRRTSAQLKIAALQDATTRDLGFGELGLKEQLGMRELDIQQQRADTEASAQSFQKKKSIIASIGSGILGAIGLFSHSVLKENIEDFNTEDALKVIEDLEVVKYNYRPGFGLGHERRHVGVLADHSPEEISTGHSVVEGDAIFTLVAAVQALVKRVKELEDK